MFNKKIDKKVKELVEKFFEKTSFKVLIKIEESEKDNLQILVNLDEPQALIGENGKTLFSIQHLLNKLLKKQLKVEQDFYFDLDINGYKKKKTDYLKALAREGADDVIFSKKEKELCPMTAYERRIIHMELKDRQEVITESFGQEFNRRIVIKLR